MKREKNSFDMYTLVVGGLAAAAVVIFVLAMISGRTRDEFSAGTAEYRAAVDERLRPLSQVYMPGEELQAPDPIVEEALPVVPVATVMSGPQVFNEACIVCHGNGIGGAPVLADKDNWAGRIGQGTELLYQHAIDGYTGSAGYMPPKGARADLSDDEIKGAVDYMVSEAQ